MESQRQAFHPSPRPWKSRKIGGIPTFPPLRPLIPIYKVRKKPVRNHQPWVGQIKLPKWANFSCQKHQVWTRLNPSSVPLEEGFPRDVSHVGHAGTGDLEIRLQTTADLERAQPLLLRSYQGA